MDDVSTPGPSGWTRAPRSCCIKAYEGGFSFGVKAMQRGRELAVAHGLVPLDAHTFAWALLDVADDLSDGNYTREKAVEAMRLLAHEADPSNICERGHPSGDCGCPEVNHA